MTGARTRNPGDRSQAQLNREHRGEITWHSRLHNSTARSEPAEILAANLAVGLLSVGYLDEVLEMVWDPTIDGQLWRETRSELSRLYDEWRQSPAGMLAADVAKAAAR